MNAVRQHPVPYRLVRSIGRGGFAEVFRAEPRSNPGAVVAFKRPRRVPLAGERMKREIDVQQQLAHVNVMPILDADPESRWFVMPLAEGNLEDLWASGELGSDPEAVAMTVLDQASRGLEAAHSLGFVHRDVSPRNILAMNEATTGRRWVVADWGTVRRPAGKTRSRLTLSREGLGTEGFAAPETWADAHSADARADVYSLGQVVGWLMTGRWPQPNVPLVPDGVLRGPVYECTLLDRERRIRSMEEVRQRLETLTEAHPQAPRWQAQELIDQAIADDESDRSVEALRLAAANRDDPDLFLDELARLPVDHLEEFVAEDADLAASLGHVMLQHLEGDWGTRDFNYANTPLRWTFEILANLVQAGRLREAEDLAASFFVTDKAWNRFKQMPITVRWLRALREPAGTAIARALRRSGASDYYKMAMEGERIASRSIAMEFER